MPFLLIPIVAVFAASAAFASSAVPEWTPADPEGVPALTPVRLRLGPDVLPFGYDAQGPWKLAKRKDSVRAREGGPRLAISELALRHAGQVYEVGTETWIGREKNSVHLAFGYKDSAGKTASIEGWIGLQAIDRVFVPAPEEPRASIAAEKPGPGWIFAGMVIGGISGLIYGKYYGLGDGSVPGLSVLLYTFGGAMISLTYTIPTTCLN